MRFVLPFLGFFVAAVATSAAPGGPSALVITGTELPSTLSAFGFFESGTAAPSAALIPYQLRTPLFSDYAIKQRFMYLPGGAKLNAGPDGRLIFPVGAALIKSFGYPAASGGLNVIETRVLLHRQDGWVALPYVWRTDGSDADLRVGGTRMAVTFDHDGVDMSTNYAVPNKNQCKQCHGSGDEIRPIGPIWQNMEFPKSADRERIMQMVPALARLTPFAKWDVPESGSLDERARQYLRVNCGHCHSQNGAASNSGLFLDGSAQSPASFGIEKRPVAAGRASGDLNFIIAPGKPDQSILIKRMESTDPGTAMPELGRSTVHREGVGLLRNWIGSMPPTAH